MTVTDLRVIAALGARSVKQTFRRPQLMAPIIVFPSIILPERSILSISAHVNHRVSIRSSSIG